MKKILNVTLTEAVVGMLAVFGGICGVCFFFGWVFRLLGVA